MLISKDHRRQIHEALFKEGVLVAKKDHNAPSHMEIEGIPNLEVIKACQSLTSRGYVKTQFSWQYYYYVLTSEGIEYLREWLHLPQEIVPATLKKPARPQRPAPPSGGAYRAPRGGPGDRPQFGDDGGYRRRGPPTYGDEGKKEGASGDFRPRFAGGFGRGGGAPGTNNPS